MQRLTPIQIKHLVNTAKQFGASLAGVTPIQPVLECPSTRVHHDLNHLPRTGSLLVLALEHPITKPGLDHWGGSRGTDGNRILYAISEKLTTWLGDDLGITGRILPYQVRRGGTYLKDTAALSGIGVIGANNLLVTQEFGSRVRLAAMLLDIQTEPPPVLDFDPCRACQQSCTQACKQHAFPEGRFSRPICMIQMQADENRSKDSGIPYVAYCRKCELACLID